jgi:hypothetical protein
MTVGIISAQQYNFYLDYQRGDKVVNFPNGQINWSKNLVIATASSDITLVEQKDYSYRESIIKNTGEKARENLFQIIINLKVDNYRDIKFVMDEEKEIGKNLSMTFKKYSTVLEPIFITNTKIEVTAQIPIYGTNSLAQALYDLYLLEDESFGDKFDPNLSLRNIEYKKLIIDVRGMNFNPSIFPRIYYEVCDDVECRYNLSSNMRKEKFYLPEIIPLNIRNRNNYISYYKDPFRYKDEIWISYKADILTNENMSYYTAALRIEGENNTDIVIHKSDAERFFTKQSNIDMILDGNIFILTD